MGKFNVLGYITLYFMHMGEISVLVYSALYGSSIWLTYR